MESAECETTCDGEDGGLKRIELMAMIPMIPPNLESNTLKESALFFGGPEVWHISEAKH